MKKLLTLLTLLLTAGFLYSQENELIVESTDVGILNQTIFGDTTETGDRANPDRVYVLRRATPYLISESIRYSGFHLRIKAEEGDGARPLLIFSVGTGGETLDQLFRLDDGADLTIDGVHITCKDNLGNYINRAIRMSGDKGKVVVNNCIIEEAGQSAFRLNADSIKVFVTNSIVNRIGEPTDPNNGRFMDNRGHPLDTVWVENSIVYNLTSRWYRPGSGNMLLNGIYNQNTFFGSGISAFNWGHLGNLTFTNNILANGAYFGSDNDSFPEFVLDSDTLLNGIEAVNISYNNIYLGADYAEAVPETTVLGDTIKYGPTFGPRLSDAVMSIASGTTIISEDLAFTDPPNIPTQFIAAGADTTFDNAGEWDFSDLTPDDSYTAASGNIDRYTTYHDFSYPEEAISTTAGTQGQPLGANIDGTQTGVEEDYFITNQILYYPNPVKETLFIQNLDRAELERVSVYDLNGVRLLSQKVQGINTRFNLAGLPQGTYVLTVRDQAGKISSRKIVKY